MFINLRSIIEKVTKKAEKKTLNTCKSFFFSVSSTRFKLLFFHGSHRLFETSQNTPIYQSVNELKLCCK